MVASVTDEVTDEELVPAGDEVAEVCGVAGQREGDRAAVGGAEPPVAVACRVEQHILSAVPGEVGADDA